MIPEASQDILRTAGRWLKVNGEAVYGAGTSPFGEEYGEYSSRGGKDIRGQKQFLPQTQWRVTSKPGKLYFTFFDEPRAPFAISLQPARQARRPWPVQRGAAAARRSVRPQRRQAR